MICVEIKNRLFFSSFEPAISMNLGVVLDGFAVPGLPGIELVLGDPQPGDELILGNCGESRWSNHQPR
jgi:hypothetical protein